MKPLSAVSLLVAIGTAVALRAQEPPPKPPDAPQQTFGAFLAGIRTEALAMGIRATTLDAAFAGLEPNPVVVARDRAQPEATQSLDEYLAARLSAQRIQTGRKMAETHAEILARVEKAYGLPAAIMVSIWGLESNFGSFTGSYSTINSLATLAYDGRRPLFRDELFAALKIIDSGRSTVADLKGSWAGAMGQPQFMPTSYLRHAVDFDADGRVDIWTTVADVLGSMANYLKAAGWQPGGAWGREVKVSKDVIAKIDKSVAMRTRGCRALREMTVARPIADWNALGVTLPDGNDLPAGAEPASLVRGRERYFLVHGNYDAILGYNCSNAYAVSVGMLGDRISQQ